MFQQSKEPEYTKVRRVGTRLRDSDPQDVQFLESDNPGSTDSEVRKILTLHIPITEYDTLGSESDNECSAKSMKQSKYKSQRGLLTLKTYFEFIEASNLLFLQKPLTKLHLHPKIPHRTCRESTSHHIPPENQRKPPH